jgi:hypothetical protein
LDERLAPIQQREAWLEEVGILRAALADFDGWLFVEFKTRGWYRFRSTPVRRGDALMAQVPPCAPQRTEERGEADRDCE